MLITGMVPGVMHASVMQWLHSTSTPVHDHPACCLPNGIEWLKYSILEAEPGLKWSACCCRPATVQEGEEEVQESRGDDRRRYEFALESNLGPSMFHRTKVST